MKVRHARKHRHTQMNTKDVHTRTHVIQLSIQCSMHAHTHMYVCVHTVCVARQRHIPIETYVCTVTQHSQNVGNHVQRLADT